MAKYLLIIVLAISGGLVGAYMFKTVVEPMFGSTTARTTVTNPWTFTATTTMSSDEVVSGGTLNVTTANTATSTIVGGCFQFYATSTATAQRFQASTTPGVMYSQYGTCPNL